MEPDETATSGYPRDYVYHDDVIKWKHFPHYWPFVRGIHRSPVNSPHKDQWRGALVFSLICTRINGWVNNGEAGDLRRKRAHYDVTLVRYIDLQTQAEFRRGWDLRCFENITWEHTGKIYIGLGFELSYTTALCNIVTI